MSSEQKTITNKDPPSLWRIVKETHPKALEMANRHYSRKHPGTPIFMGPGSTMVLMTYDNRALFGWRVQVFRLDGQKGVECNIFRNEGSKHLSSDLILEAERKALDKWHNTERFFTYVNPTKIRKKRDPGRCFIKAGWSECGKSKVNGLLIFEKLITLPTSPKSNSTRRDFL